MWCLCQRELLAAESRGSRVVVAMRDADREHGEGKDNGELPVEHLRRVLDHLGVALAPRDFDALVQRCVRGWGEVGRGRPSGRTVRGGRGWGGGSP